MAENETTNALKAAQQWAAEGSEKRGVTFEVSGDGVRVRFRDEAGATASRFVDLESVDDIAPALIEAVGALRRIWPKVQKWWRQRPPVQRRRRRRAERREGRKGDAKGAK